ncbi:MAG: hypothetical protein IJ057_10975 [Bacteroidales bacterium]|nr:hypothetical protein [Bacteroidales bacterium]
MNNTFSFNRFKDLLLKDGKMYFRNYGTSLIIWCCLNASFWIFNLIFGTSSEAVFRFGMLCVWMALAMMMVPSKVYGNANLSREGVGFAMLPVSSLEKFISMFLYCAIVTPIIVFFGGYLVDTLLSLFPLGGFEKPIHLYTMNEIVRLMNDTEGVVRAGELDLSIEQVFPIGVMRTSLYMGIIQWAAIFMLGNMLFKKHKTGATLGCYMGISYVLSTIFGAIMFANGERLEQWMKGLSNYPTGEIVRLWHNATIWGMILGIVITAVLLYFTYRKIKTQKY